ncbi:MAG: glycosyltransferase family 4 protein [Melioribacteraceae bacterium]|nr:glycosyltransferase family 4 protein [Melioribacteraceae bacterium]
MTILHTVEMYNPVVCGVQEVVQKISEVLVKRGHEVTVATTYNPDRNFKELNGVKIEHFNISGKWVRGFKGEKNKYTEFLHSFNGDIMMNYAALQWGTDLVYPILKKLPYKKILIPCGYSTFDNWKWRPYYWMLPGVLKKYNHIIYHCKGYRDFNFGIKNNINNYTVIPNGVAIEEFEHATGGFKNEYGIKQTNMFLCVSNYGPYKNQEFVIKAFINAGLKDSSLVLIGSKFNEYSNYLKSLLGNNCNNIYFFEKLQRNKIVSAYIDADLFLFGSKIEYMPLVILEAMASSTPFISTDVGCVGSLPGGMIVDSLEKMVYSINWLMKNSEVKNTFANEGRKAFMEFFNWEKIINEYEKVFYIVLYSAESINIIN